MGGERGRRETEPNACGDNNAAAMEKGCAPLSTKCILNLLRAVVSVIAS